jgi:hypothetical protein
MAALLSFLVPLKLVDTSAKLRFLLVGRLWTFQGTPSLWSWATNDRPNAPTLTLLRAVAEDENNLDRDRILCDAGCARSAGWSLAGGARF